MIEHLGGCRDHGAAGYARRTGRVVNGCQSKINELHGVHVLTNQKVLELDVSMYYILAVQVVHSLHHLVEYFLRGLLVERHVDTKQ